MNKMERCVGELETDVIILRNGLDKLICFAKDALIDVRRSAAVSEQNLLELAVNLKEGLTLITGRINGIESTTQEIRELMNKPAASCISPIGIPQVIRFGADPQTHLTDFITVTLEAETSKAFNRYVAEPLVKKLLGEIEKGGTAGNEEALDVLEDQIDITVGSEIDDIIVNLGGKCGYKPKFLFCIGEKRGCSQERRRRAKQRKSSIERI